MNDFRRFVSVCDVKEYVSNIPESSDLSWGRVYRDDDGCMCCEFSFVDDQHLLVVFRERNKCRRRITDGMCGILLSFLLFVFYFMVPDHSTVDGAICQSLVFNLLPWFGGISLLFGIGYIIYGSRCLNKSADIINNKFNQKKDE